MRERDLFNLMMNRVFLLPYLQNNDPENTFMWKISIYIVNPSSP